MPGYICVETPIGPLRVVSDGESITRVDLPGSVMPSSQEAAADYPILIEAKKQLEEYFSGSRNEFDLPLSIIGTPFQMRIWEALREIPFGQSLNYAEIAAKAGSPKAVRAAGQANKANKLPIFIPCHRVIGKNQSLTGYAGSKTDLKAILLEHEKIEFNR
ncbi:methylated-DNA--[protein]-cysteine S-methyltransferase [Bacillus sp. FJAT-42376]|uniref:methylated-DNA--[protein]-cysteine S-methyltransferase n=1 Tax=Bacillus sp. FJAT-42376 TaxID=2014076 RepID=UPI001F1528F2|nr:methylated-DNA--[protein]-cysteine S-methyltransferase [Bacillus sp. FJAT-42376]